MGRLWDAMKRTVSGDSAAPPDLDATLAELRAKTPAPVFWLFGKTQSGKTSIIRYLTGADDAVIGSGFRPCTKTSRQYQFPNPDAPLLTFLDTRGVDEPGYDPAEDVAAFDPTAHVVIVTAKATDFAQGHVRDALARVRAASRSRPVVLAVTNLHEAIPREPHPVPYPFGALLTDPRAPLPDAVPRPLRECVDEHRRAFGELYDHVVALDLTKPGDGFPDPNYGGEQLKQVLLAALPAAYRQTLLRLKDATEALKDVHLRHAMPVILGYASIAGTAGAVPIPFVDMAVLPGIQARMAYQLAAIYGQPMSAERLKEIGTAVGVGMLTRTLARQATKFIPFVGSAIGATVAAASTFALGRALCFYFSAVCEGHVPSADALRAYYQEQYAAAETRWKDQRKT